MEVTEVISIVTIVVTLISGVLAKKYEWFNTRLIPIQNLVIGIVVAIIEWIVTKDFSVAVALSGVIAGGTYDIFHNLEKITKGE